MMEKPKGEEFMKLISDLADAEKAEKEALEMERLAKATHSKARVHTMKLRDEVHSRIDEMVKAAKA